MVILVILSFNILLPHSMLWHLLPCIGRCVFFTQVRLFFSHSFLPFPLVYGSNLRVKQTLVSHVLHRQPWCNTKTLKIHAKSRATQSKCWRWNTEAGLAGDWLAGDDAAPFTRPLTSVPLGDYSRMEKWQKISWILLRIKPLRAFPSRFEVNDIYHV